MDFYPVVIDDEENLAVERDLIHSPLTVAVDDNDTTFTVEDGGNYDENGGIIEIDDEACSYTSVTIGPPDTLNGVTRGLSLPGYGPAAAHTVGAEVLQYRTPHEQHTHAQQIIAIEEKLGIGASEPAADTVLVGTDAGESEWALRANVGMVPTGSVIMWGKATAPAGWLLCDGATVSRTTYAALFAAIGATYGAGDGSTTFKLPDLRGRFPIGLGPEVENSALGESGGVRTVQLTAEQSGLPSHSHNPGTLAAAPPGGHTHPIPSFDEQNNTQGGSSGDRLVRVATVGGGPSGPFSGSHSHSISGSTASNSAAGGAASHTNLPPFQTVNFIIKS